MSKKKVNENTAKRQENLLNIPYAESEFEKKYSGYFWIIIPVLTILYFLYRNIAIGFYQDDEVAQYINMLQFWKDPWVILGNGPKPGYKIFTVIPALISYDAVLIFNAFVASVTVYMTYILIKSYKINYGIFGALLLATQPLYVNLSFRSYSEIFTALCIVCFLLLYRKEKYIYSSLLLGYIYTIRQEIALLIMIFTVIYAFRKQYLNILALAAFPVIYNLLGFIKTGDILFVFTEMSSVAGLNYKSQGLLHYFKVYIFITGPVCLTMFLAGFFGFFNDTSKFKEYIRRYYEFYLIFISIFIIQMLTMVSDGPNPGNWRYLLHISPICAFFAAAGLNNLSISRFKNTNYIITGILSVFVLLFLSKATDGFILLEKPEYTNIIFVLLVLALSILLWKKLKPGSLNSLGAALILLAAIHLYFVEPKKLSPENISVRETAEFLDSIPEIKDRQKLTNHTFIMFYSNQYKDNTENFRKLDLKNLGEAPKGTLIIWESHYGYRPEFKNDVPIDILQDESKYRLIKQFVSDDRRFGSFIFEKL